VEVVVLLLWVVLLQVVPILQAVLLWVVPIRGMPLLGILLWVVFLHMYLHLVQVGLLHIRCFGLIRTV
jgi:hypothetical protein